MTVPFGALPGTALRCSWRGVNFLATCPELVGPGQRFVVVLPDAANDHGASIDPDIPTVGLQPNRLCSQQANKLNCSTYTHSNQGHPLVESNCCSNASLCWMHGLMYKVRSSCRVLTRGGARKRMTFCSMHISNFNISLPKWPQRKPVP